MNMSTKLWSHLIAGASGAAAAYYFDPGRGGARRARARELLLAAGRDMTEDVEKRARYYEGKVEGAQARATGRGTMAPVDDHLVKQGIQQELAAAGADTTDAVIDVADGVVGLRGKAASSTDIKKIELTAMGVPGVDQVESWLHLPGEVAPNKAVAIRTGADH